MPSVIFYPAVSGDDTDGPNGFSSSNTFVTIGYDNSAAMTITCRFPKFTISPGSTITSAKLHAFEYATRTGNVLSNIYCNDVDNAIAPTTEAELTNLVKTTAYVAWDAVSADASEFTSPDISSVIQEIIDRDGWKSGNAIQIIWTDDGSARYSYRMISAIEYNSGSEKMELHIEWTAGAGTVEDGHLLIEATINDTLYRVSTDSVSLEHSWDPHVISFDAPNLDSTAAYGGFCKVTFGSISFNPVLFDAEWFPPDKISLAIKYTETNEAEAKDVFSATAYLSKVMDSEVTYDVRDFEYNKTILDECIDVDENIDVPVPYVIGTVSHATPVRIGPTWPPRYRIDGIDLTNPEVQIKLISMYDALYTKIETFSAHGFSNDDSIIVSDTRDFNGTYSVSSVTPTTFLIEKAFNPGVPLFQIASFEEYPIIGDFLNDSFDDWSIAICDFWEFTIVNFDPGTPHTITKEESTVHDGTASVKIEFGACGYQSYCTIKQDVPAHTSYFINVKYTISVWVYWNSTDTSKPVSLSVYHSPFDHIFYTDVYPDASWQQVELVVNSYGYNMAFDYLPIYIRILAASSVFDGEVLYIDGPISITKTGNEYTRVALALGSPFYRDRNCTIIGTTNYDDSYTVLDNALLKFIIMQTYVAEIPNGVTEKAYSNTQAITEQNVTGHVVGAAVDPSFRLYDNGIPITDNYFPWRGSFPSFGLNAEPTGPVTISGTGTLTTLDEVMAAVAVIGGLSYNNDSARNPSPEIAVIITTQSILIDYITTLCEFYTHMTYILSDTLYLVDSKGINQEHPSGVTLTEHDFFSIAYNGRTFLKEIRSSWTTKIMTVGLPNAGTIYILEDEERKVSANLVFLLSDTVTSIAADKLIDGVATFDTEGTVTGQYAKNLNTGDLAEITVVDSETQLTLDDDIFAALETTVWGSGTIWESGTIWGFESLPRYTIGEIFSSGSEMDVTAYHQEKENVLDAILDIQEIVVAHKMEVHIPMKISTWLLPGELLILTDTRKSQDISVQMKIRSLKYDFNNYTIIVGGEGSIS